jgi:hypothetical protein
MQETVKDLKGNSLGLLEVLSRRLPGRQRKTTDILRQKSRFSGGYSNRAPPEYRCTVLLLRSVYRSGVSWYWARSVLVHNHWISLMNAISIVT